MTAPLKAISIQPVFLLTTFNARLGEESLAAAAYAMQIMGWVIVFADSLGLGTEIMIGHLIGLGDLERAYREHLRSLRLGILLACIASVLVALAAPAIAGAFTTHAGTAALIVSVRRLGMLLEPGRVFNEHSRQALAAVMPAG